MSSDDSEATGAHNLRPRKTRTVNQLPLYFPVTKSIKKAVSDKQLVSVKTDDDQHEVSDLSQQGGEEIKNDGQIAEGENDSDDDDVEANLQGPPAQSGAAPPIPPAAAIPRCDEDEDMAHHTSLLAPDVFRGTKGEEAEEWLTSVNHWLKFKQFTDAQSCTELPVLLRDSALCWYNALPDATKADLTLVTEAFLRRYKTDGITGWQDNAAIWTTKQQPTQSVDDYINLMEKKAAKTTAPAEQKRHAVIHGLRPAIRQQVLQHEITTVDQVRHWGNIAESSESQAENQSEVATTLKAIQDHRARLHSDRYRKQRQPSRQR